MVFLNGTRFCLKPELGSAEIEKCSAVQKPLWLVMLIGKAFCTLLIQAKLRFYLASAAC
jgi:hypothetical protein